jgi:hypothetical protein
MSAGTTTGTPAGKVIIGSRFAGPPGSGNGGYSAGSFAALVDGPAEVTLRRPIPLEAEIACLHGSDGVITFQDTAGPVATVRQIPPLDEVEPPTRPSVEQADACLDASPFLSDDHPFPGCFVCGHAHPDGLALYAGPLEDDAEIGAATLRPTASLPSGGGALAPEIVWSALDCPSYTAGMMDSPNPYVLGRLSAELRAPVPADSPSVVVGWELAREGRKLHSACAILSPDGELLARSRALWIALKSSTGGTE